MGSSSCALNFVWYPPVTMLTPPDDDDTKAVAKGLVAKEMMERNTPEEEEEEEGDEMELRDSPLLGGLTLDVPEVFEREIIARLLDDHDRAMLSRTCRDVRAVVLASGGPRAGAASRDNDDRLDDQGGSGTTHANEEQQRGRQGVVEPRHTSLNAKHFTRRLPLMLWALDNGMPLHWRTMEYAGKGREARGGSGRGWGFFVLPRDEVFLFFFSPLVL